jgi:hypothetical protein
MKATPTRLLSILGLLMASTMTQAGTPVGYDRTASHTAVTDDGLLEKFFQPSLDLRYTFDDDMEFTDFCGKLSMHEAEVTVPLPVVRSGNFRLLGALYYRYYQMQVDTPGLKRDLDLHTLRVPIQAAWLSPTTPWFYYVLLEPGVSSDFDSVSRDSIDISASVDVGYRFSSTFVLALGVYYTRDYGDDVLLPSIGLLWTPNETFSLNVTPAGIISTINCSEDWRLRLKAIPYGGRWTVSNDKGGSERIELSGGKVGIDVEHRLGKDAWLSVGAGVNVFSNLRYEDSRGREVLDRDLDPALYVTAGLHWTF